MKYLLFVSLFYFISCNKNYCWTSIGDSITWQNDHNYSDGTKAIGYQNAFISMQKVPIDLHNQGFNGLPLAGSSKSVYSTLLNYNFKKSNLVTIFVGTNDFKLNKPIYSKDSLNSFSYCLDSFVNRSKISNPKAKIYLFTPLQRNKDGFDIISTNSAGYRLIDYRNEIISISKKHNVHFIDLYNESGITIQNLDQFTRDRLHPNNEGYDLIAKKLFREITL